MNILPINRADNNINFKTCFRKYPSKSMADFKDFAMPYVLTSTNIFREDVDWKNLVKYILFHFAEKKKVQSFSLACSDGSEAYTYAISLMEKIPDSSFGKFFPVKAVDIDSTMINLANRRLINLFDTEFYYASKLYNVDLNNYFKKISDNPVTIQNDDLSDIPPIALYEPIDELKENVQFKNSDILTELRNIKDEGNSVVMCRNVMPYLSKDYMLQVVKAAKENLKKGSLFIIGDYDRKSNIEELLERNGFFRPLINQNNVFQRGSIKELTDRLYSGYLI